MENLLEVKNVSKKYRKQMALDEVTLGIKRGEIYGLVRNAKIKSCSNKITLTCGMYSASVGGIAGYSYNTKFQYCSNYGELIPKCTGWGGYDYVGGICAEIYSYVENMFLYANNYGTLSPKRYSGGVSNHVKKGDFYAVIDTTNYQ